MLWPVAALTIPGDSAPVGDTRDIASVPSATLLALLRARARGDHGATKLLAVSRTTDASGHTLPGIEQELRRLARGYRNVTVRANRGDRTVAQLTSGLSDWQALHFAAHSESDPHDPWRSGFLLGKGNGEDAYLRASSVVGMRLRARLAVLSTCQSAGTTALVGEGALGIGASFLCAGTTSVVATLWPVEDRAAERFMREFYNGLAGGKTVSAAAGAARLALRRGAGAVNPRDWAAFTVLGEPGTRLSLQRHNLLPSQAGP